MRISIDITAVRQRGSTPRSAKPEGLLAALTPPPQPAGEDSVSLQVEVDGEADDGLEKRLEEIGADAVTMASFVGQAVGIQQAPDIHVVIGGNKESVQEQADRLRGNARGEPIRGEKAEGDDSGSGGL